MENFNKYADVFCDPTFKYLFGEAGKRSLISLLSTFLGIPDIEEITYLPTEKIGLGKGDKRTHYDIACKTSDGRRFIVEAQVAEQEYFNYRAILYLSRMVGSAVRDADEKAKGKGEVWNYEFSPIYLLTLFKGTDELSHSSSDCIHTYRMKDVCTGDDMNAEVSITFVELGKYNEGIHQGKLEQWLYTLRNIENLDDMPDWITDSEIQEFYNMAEVANLPISVREEIDKFMTTEQDWKNALNYAEKKSYKKGLTEGKAEGLAEGKIEIAKAMMLAGEPIEKIVLYSELTEEQIKALGNN